MLPSHLRLGLPSGLFPSVSPPKPCTHLSSLPYALHAPSISFFLILSPEQYFYDYSNYINYYKKNIHVSVCHKYVYCSNYATCFDHQGYQSDNTGRLEDLPVALEWQL